MWIFHELLDNMVAKSKFQWLLRISFERFPMGFILGLHDFNGVGTVLKVMCPFAPFPHVQNLSLQSFKQANFCSVWFKSHVFVSSDCKFHKLTTLFCILLMCERLSNNSTNKIECRYMRSCTFHIFRWFYYFNLHNNYLMCSLKDIVTQGEISCRFQIVCCYKICL